MAASSTFAARYPGRCGECQGKIEVDDDVVYVAGSVEHAVCDSTDRLAAAAAGPVCPRCFLELPLSGTCGNCD